MQWLRFTLDTRRCRGKRSDFINYLLLDTIKLVDIDVDDLGAVV